MIEVLNPTYDDTQSTLAVNDRLLTLEGMTIGIVSNGKQGTGRFFDSLTQRLQSHHGVAKVERLVKPNYSAPAGAEVMDATAGWHGLISGIGD